LPAALFALSAPTLAVAGGLEVGERTPLGLARGGAVAASVRDPSAVDLNPGALARLKGAHAFYSHEVTWQRVRFERAPSVIPQDANVTPSVDPYAPVSEQGDPFALGAMVAASHDLGLRDWVFALSLYGPHGVAAQAWPRAGGQRWLTTGYDGMILFPGVSVAWGGPRFGVGITAQAATMPRLNYRLVVDGSTGSGLAPLASAAEVEAAQLPRPAVWDPATFPALALALVMQPPSPPPSRDSAALHDPAALVRLLSGVPQSMDLRVLVTAALRAFASPDDVVNRLHTAILTKTDLLDQFMSDGDEDDITASASWLETNQRDWLRYEVPDHFIKREVRGHYRGQKQIWFLLRMMGRDCDVNLRISEHPEFDAWRWHDYWVPMDMVIEFKRDVYTRALQELSRFLNRSASGARQPANERVVTKNISAPNEPSSVTESDTK
jgi:hypothetical protein